MSVRFDPDIHLTDYHPRTEDFLEHVLNGLSQPQKQISSKFFYDEKGARLFEQISESEDYYLTRIERQILDGNIDEIASLAGERIILIEFGSGNSMKTRTLLDHLNSPVAYIPIDISREQLVESARALTNEYPDILIHPICADYTTQYLIPDIELEFSRKIAYYPGSTIGNMHPDTASAFLRRMGEIVGTNGGIIVGVDLAKDPALILPAYNDREGYTAAFNLNLLSRINRELGGNFEIGSFRHQGIYNEKAHRIESNIISKKEQVVRIKGEEFHFDEGESIVTEHSYKHTLEEFAGIAKIASLRAEKIWTDPNRFFSILYLSPMY